MFAFAKICQRNQYYSHILSQLHLRSLCALISQRCQKFQKFNNQYSWCVLPPFGNPNFEHFKKGENLTNIWDQGKQKGWQIFRKKGGAQLSKLNLVIENNKNWDFKR